MKPSLQLILCCGCVIAAAFLADAWRGARRDSQQLAATLAAQSALLQSAGDREKQRDAQLAAALASIHAQTRAVRTPQQAARELPSVLPPLPLPVSIHFPDLPAPLPPGESAPATLSIPQPDLQPLYDDLQNCRATAIESEAAQKDLSDEKARSAALLRERDAALAAARGGAFWQRLKRSAKWFAIGVAAGAAATALAHR